MSRKKREPLVNKKVTKYLNEQLGVIQEEGIPAIKKLCPLIMGERHVEACKPHDLLKTDPSFQAKIRKLRTYLNEHKREDARVIFKACDVALVIYFREAWNLLMEVTRSWPSAGVWSKCNKIAKKIEEGLIARNRFLGNEDFVKAFFKVASFLYRRRFSGQKEVHFLPEDIAQDAWMELMGEIVWLEPQSCWDGVIFTKVRNSFSKILKKYYKEIEAKREKSRNKPRRSFSRKGKNEELLEEDIPAPDRPVWEKDFSKGFIEVLGSVVKDKRCHERKKKALRFIQVENVKKAAEKSGIPLYAYAWFRKTFYEAIGFFEKTHDKDGLRRRLENLFFDGKFENL